MIKEDQDPTTRLAILEKYLAMANLEMQKNGLEPLAFTAVGLLFIEGDALTKSRLTYLLRNLTKPLINVV